MVEQKQTELKDELSNLSININKATFNEPNIYHISIQCFRDEPRNDDKNDGNIIAFKTGKSKKTKDPQFVSQSFKIELKDDVKSCMYYCGFID